jgi:hypothetical protein
VLDRKVEYEARINQRFGDQRELDFVTPPKVILPPPKVTQPRAVSLLPLFDGLPDEAAN